MLISHSNRLTDKSKRKSSQIYVIQSTRSLQYDWEETNRCELLIMESLGKRKSLVSVGHL